MKGLDVLKALASGKRVAPKRWKGEYGCYFFALEDGRICYKNHNGVKKINNIDFIEEYQDDFEIYTADEDDYEKSDEYCDDKADDYEKEDDSLETNEYCETKEEYNKNNEEDDGYYKMRSEQCNDKGYKSKMVRCIDCKNIHELLLFDVTDKTRNIFNLCKAINNLTYTNSFSKSICNKFEKSEYQFKENI